MRFALFSIMSAGLLATAAASETPVALRTLTIVLEFRGMHSKPAVAAMERETEQILGAAGIAFDWRLRGQTQPETSGSLIFVRFNGRCILSPVGYLYDERGPLAYTYSTDGEVQPFSEVTCEPIVSSLRSGMQPGDFSRADQIFGRALGRVLAHELVHILTGESTHGTAGVARKALSPAHLAAPILQLAPEDLQRIRAFVRSVQ